MRHHHLTVLAAATLVLLAAGYVAFDRDVVLRTRTIVVTEHYDTAVDGFADRFAEVTDDGRTAGQLGAVIIPHGERQHLVRVGVYSPTRQSQPVDPAGSAPAVERRTPPARGPPSDWSPFTYRRDRNGSLHVDLDGLREHTTTSSPRWTPTASTPTGSRTPSR